MRKWWSQLDSNTKAFWKFVLGPLILINLITVILWVSIDITTADFYEMVLIMILVIVWLIYLFATRKKDHG